MKRRMLACLFVLAVLLMTGCGTPAEPETIRCDSLKSVAATLYENGVPRTETYEYDVSGSTAEYDWFSIGDQGAKTTPKEKVPEPLAWIEYRFTPRTGEPFTMRVFTDEKGKTNYLDFENGNTLKYDVPFQRASLMENGRNALKEAGFETLGNRLANGEATASPRYSGANKAWVVSEGTKGLSEGDSFLLPETRRAEYAEDVRWLFTVQTERHYTGYAWVQNGQIVGYDHESYCGLSVTDLLMGEQTVLIGEKELYNRRRFGEVCAEWLENK